MGAAAKALLDWGINMIQVEPLISAVLTLAAAIPGGIWLGRWVFQRRERRRLFLSFIVALICVAVTAIIALGAIAVFHFQEPVKGDVPAKSSELISDPKIIESNEPTNLFAFYGTFSRDGASATVYVEFDFADRSEVKRGDGHVIFPRIVKLKEYKDFIKGQPVAVTLASYEPPTANVVLRWGTGEYGPSVEEDRFTPRDPIIARVIIADEKKEKQFYSFWLFPKINEKQWFILGRQQRAAARTGQPALPLPEMNKNNILLVTQDMVNTQAQWK